MSGNNFKSLRTLVVVLFLSFIVGSCGKDKMKWVYYDETVCADPWSFHINNERLKDNVTAHFDSKGVRIYEIEIFSDRVAEACTACTCKTGRRFQCKVKRGDVSTMKSEDFYE